jgi:hypothetical protein
MSKPTFCNSDNQTRSTISAEKIVSSKIALLIPPIVVAAKVVDLSLKAMMSCEKLLFGIQDLPARKKLCKCTESSTAGM